MANRNDEGNAPTLVQPSAPTLPERSSRSELSALSAGSMIGRYRLVKRLGAGAMGVVWLAHDPQLDRGIAIKLVHPGLVRDDEVAARLQREARAMAKLSHRAVVTVHDAGNVDGQLFIAMELVDGTNLGTMLRARTAADITDWQRWLGMLLDAGRGLEAAHQGGVLHRDFKPDNVLVAASGRVCVGDFGVASLGDDAIVQAASRREVKKDLHLTTTGALLGTPVYMSPQALRGEALDARADQFSFCVAAWEAVYGARPFTVKSTGLEAVVELADTIEAGVLPPPPPGSTVPAAVHDTLARGLSADPAARWPDMGSLLVALERALRPAAPEVAATPRPPFGRRGQLVVGAVALGAVGLTIAFLAGRHRGSNEPPRPVATAPASSAIAKRLFTVSMRTGVALSGDGKRLALYSDRLQVRALDGAALWSTLLPNTADEVSHMEFDGDDLLFSMRLLPTIFRWRYAGDGTTVVEATRPTGAWLGRTTAGDLIWDEVELVLRLVDHDREIRHWLVPAGVDASAIAPDRRRFAFIESGRFRARLVVHDVASDREVAAMPLVSPTSVAWIDDTTLLFATGTLEQPRVHRVNLGASGFGTPVEVYGTDHGWLGSMAAHGDQLYLVQMQPSPRARVVDRSGVVTTSRDLDHASVSLGWTSEIEFLTWSRNTDRIERRSVDVAFALSDARIEGEPANATTAGDVVIASARRSSGRETIAVSRADGHELWRHRDGKTLAVRCAGDQRPPCVAIRALDTGDQLVTIDPSTGELGTTPIATGKIEDVAVHPTEDRLLLVGDGRTVRELDRAGKLLETYIVPSSTIRSVAWDPTGGFLIGGTVLRNNYVVGRFKDGGFQPLVQSDDDILSLVRPSPEGKRLLVLARVFAPEVWQVTLPSSR